MYYNSYYDRQIGTGQPEIGMGQMGMGAGMGQMGMGQMGMGAGMGMEIAASDMALIDDISRAIVLEAQAYNLYERLAQLAPNEQDRMVIKRIQRDEAKHYHWFTMILRRMGGQQPQLTPGPLPTEFVSGVRYAIQNELEAAAFYQDIAYRASSHFIQMHFMHASHDEQRHATWFQNMLLNQ